MSGQAPDPTGAKILDAAARVLTDFGFKRATVRLVAKYAGGHYGSVVMIGDPNVDPDPGVAPWLGYRSGPVDKNYGELTIPQLQIAASGAGKLFAA